MTNPGDLPLDQFIDLGDRRLRVRRLIPGKGDGFERTTLVFLHEGLGCIEMWRDFPQRLCDATRCAGIVYDRTGYGRSSPWPSNPGVRYMELESDEVLPRLLEALGVSDCVLVGHSDGSPAASRPGEGLMVMRSLRSTVALLSAGALAGCAVGPDFAKPVTGLHDVALTPRQEGASGRCIQGEVC